jgi:hypothetical protein
MRAVEVKVKVATYASIVAGAGIAILNAAVADQSLLGSLPAWLQFVLIALVPGAITWLGGYVTPSTTSKVSDSFGRDVPPL